MRSPDEIRADHASLQREHYDPNARRHAAARLLADSPDLLAEVERLNADAERQRRRAEDFEGRYETAHNSRMWAEECFRRAERERDTAWDAVAYAAAQRRLAWDTVAKVRALCERTGVEALWPADVLAALAGAAPEPECTGSWETCQLHARETAQAATPDVRLCPMCRSPHRGSHVCGATGTAQ